MTPEQIEQFQAALDYVDQYPDDDWMSSDCSFEDYIPDEWENSTC